VGGGGHGRGGGGLVAGAGGQMVEVCGLACHERKGGGKGFDVDQDIVPQIIYGEDIKS